jgi:hypothetical protein
MRVLSDTTDDNAERFTAELESALLAQALFGTGGLPDERAQALLSLWLRGTFNATVLNLRTIGDGCGDMAWEPDGTGYRLTWYTPTGLACPLARIYPQENGSWAALIVAGVRDDAGAAMAAAEWGVSRLTA